VTSAGGLRFTKMHSLGNDFVMLNAVTSPLALDVDTVRTIGDRHRGIGFDQLIVAEPAKNGADFFMRIFNTDGSESGQCGNGARCLGRYLHAQGLTTDKILEIETISTRFRLEMVDEQIVNADLAAPVFTPERVPFVADEQADRYELKVGGETVSMGVVSMGNPHAVIAVEDIDRAPVAVWGEAIERHSQFPERTNVGFVEFCSRNEINLRVWERGVGETLACGSGAGAAVAVAHRWQKINDSVQVNLPGGTLIVSWAGQGPVRMSGPTETVFEGIWRVD